MRFREVATTRLHSATLLTTDEVVLCVPREACVWVEYIHPAVDVTWLVTTILLGMEKMVVLQATRILLRNWQRQSLHMMVQYTVEDIENMVATIKVGDATLNSEWK